MASISNSSPTDDNTSGTDLSNIHTEEERANRYHRLDAS